VPSRLPRVTVRMSPAARRRVADAAAKANLGVGRWAKRVLLAALDEEAGNDKEGRTVKILVDGDVKVEVIRDRK